MPNKNSVLAITAIHISPPYKHERFYELKNHCFYLTLIQSPNSAPIHN